MSRAARGIIGLSDKVDRLCMVLAKAALVGMVAAITLQIVARYGFRAPPSWTEELARFLMVWGGLLGAAAAFRRGIDPAVTTRREIGAGWSPAFARIMLAASVLLLVLPILYYSVFGAGMDVSRSFLARNFARSSAGLEVNMIFVAAAIPTFCVVILIHLAARLVAGTRQLAIKTDAPDLF